MKNITILLVFGLFLISCSNTNKSETKETINQIVTLENDSFFYNGEKDLRFERFSMSYQYQGDLITRFNFGNKLSNEMINVMDSLLPDSSSVYFDDFIINSDTLDFTLKQTKGIHF